MVRCSVVIPAYNAQRYLTSAIRSVLAQTFTDTEIIVVDDGSTDSTAEIMESFGNRIISVHQQNQGPSVARNVGMKAASGEFIAFLDSDDLWMPRRLEQMIARLDGDRSLGFVTSDAYLINEERPTSLSYYSSLVDPSPFTCDQRYWIVRQNFIFTGVVVRAELFDRHGSFMPNILAEDWDLWTRFILEGAIVGLVDIPLGYYRIRKDGLTCSTEFVAQREAAQYRTLRDPKVKKIPGLGRDLYLPLARQALQNRDFDEASFCLTAAAQDPLMPRRTRAIAGLMSAFPEVAARVADLQAMREARQSTVSFVVAGGPLMDTNGRTYRRSDEFEGYVESDGQWAPISGWALGGRGKNPVEVFAVFVDGEFQCSVTPSVLRPDVARHVGNPNAVRCGFGLPDTGDGVPPEQDLQVFAIQGRRYQQLPKLPATTLRPERR